MNNDSFEKAKFEAFTKSFELSNLMVVAPTIRKFANRYSIDSFISSYDSSNPLNVWLSGMKDPKKGKNLNKVVNSTIMLKGSGVSMIS